MITFDRLNPFSSFAKLVLLAGVQPPAGCGDVSLFRCSLFHCLMIDDDDLYDL